jgi:glycosyltransferase involved in cell wall biosynthesis
MEQADVSIVIPTFNRRDFVNDAIYSCLNAANGMACEVIVVDDGSTDDTPQRLSQFGDLITFLELGQNAGRATARNYGLARSHGTYVKFLDSDDVLEPDSLSLEVSLAKRENADIVASGWHISQYDPITKAEKITETRCPPVFTNIVDDILAGKSVFTSAALYRRQYIEDIQWDTNVRKRDDWLYFIKAVLKGGKISILNEPAYRWRIHNYSRVGNSTSLLESARSFFYILDRVHDSLMQKGLMTDARQKKLAQYYYKELRMAWRFEPVLGANVLAKIFSLDPNFQPRDEERSHMIKMLCKILPVSYVMAAYGFLRRGIDRFS